MNNLTISQSSKLAVAAFIGSRTDVRQSQNIINDDTLFNSGSIILEDNSEYPVISGLSSETEKSIITTSDTNFKLPDPWMRSTAESQFCTSKLPVWRQFISILSMISKILFGNKFEK